MKILYVVTAAKFSGPSRHVLWMAEEMLKRGHTVGLICASEPRLTSAAKDLGIRVFPNPYFVRLFSPLNDLKSLLFVSKAIKEFDPDLVSAHSTKAGYAARFSCAVLKKPVIFTAHGWSFTEGHEFLKRLILPYAEKIAAKATSKIICVSGFDYALAKESNIAPAEKLAVIKNSIDPSPFLETKGSKTREEFNIPKDTPVLAFVGRLAPQKDLFTLLESCSLLNEEFRLLLVGDGELKGKVQAFVSSKSLGDRVILAGERSDIPEILSGSDIFVLSSKWEGLSRAIMEAMAAELPVVCTDVGGSGELVEHGVNGLLVPAGDPEALAQAIKSLLLDRNARRRMGKNGRKKILKEFTLDRMIKDTVRVCEEVLNQKL